MEEKKDIQDDIASIRSLMERSSKFISLSGLSGILAGVYALTGAAVAFCLIREPLNYQQIPFLHLLGLLPYLMGIALVVLIASIATGVLLTYRKAKKKGQPIWGKTSRDLLFNMSVPLVTGGLLILIFLYRGYFGIVAPTSLIFYGLALMAAGNFTFSDVRVLGISEIILGLITACLPGYGLLLWEIGFGVFHIVYGWVMYIKYDR